MDISEVFNETPVQWGLRGDPHLWNELRNWFSCREAPHSAEAFEVMLKTGFLEITGFPLSSEGDIYIERFNTGGMSGGYICTRFWREEAIPLLVSRYAGITGSA
jgi:molybdenum cofactor cytidylyltransferase